MTAALMLGELVAIEQLLHKDQFRDLELMGLLGKRLTAWLESFLDGVGVGTGPTVKGRVAASAVLEGRVYVGEGAVIEPSAFVKGPCYIGRDAQVRHAAYIRGSVYVGPGAVVGHTTEVKGAVFFDGAKAGHFAYVGDSILGRNVNLGAGTKLANLKLRGDEVSIKHPVTGQRLSTGLKKLGALMGDDSQTGCNAVLSPGSVLMPGTAVLPCVHYHGTLTKGIAR